MINKAVLGFLLALTLFAFPKKGFSQEVEKHEIKLLAKPTADSIMLRWAPSTYRLWISGNQYGYRVSRKLLYKDGVLVTSSPTEVLNNAPLKPVALDQWERLADRVDMAGVAAQAIFGSDFDIDTPNAKGSSISMMFQRASVQQTRYGFALLAADNSIEVANFSGLYFADKNVHKGEKYIYKVYPAAFPLDMKVDTAYFFTGVDEYLPIPPPANLSAVPADKRVTLTWEKLGQRGLFTGFFIERSDDNGKTFMPQNKAPMVNTTPPGQDEVPFYYYMDSLVNNKSTYQYRIRGITPFGELSPFSKPVLVKGIDLILFAPTITKISSADNVTVAVEWQLPEKTDTINTLVRVLRGKAYEGPFSTVADSLVAYKRLFVDKAPYSTGYYKLVAFNSDGAGPEGVARLMQLADSLPPTPPVGLVASADTTGKVVLKWKRNSEPDMYGYRIFRANSETEEFSQLTKKPMPDTVFIDKIDLRTLTKHVFYQVVAIDKRQNRSEFSAILIVNRPDIVPPTSPAFRSAQSVEKGVFLNWFPSSSNDVTHHLLYRSNNAVEWSLLTQLGAKDSLFTDSTCVNQTIYNYKLVATDSTGNKSKPTQPVAVKYSKPISNNPWITPKVKENKKKGVVELRWDASQIDATRVLIYTKNSNGQWMLLKGVENNGIEIIFKHIDTISNEYLIKY